MSYIARISSKQTGWRVDVKGDCSQNGDCTITISPLHGNESLLRLLGLDLSWWKTFAMEQYRLRVAKCIEQRRFDNAVRALGQAYDMPRLGNLVADLSLGAALASGLNLLGNRAVGGTGRTGIGGAPSHPTTWQHKVGAKLSTPTRAWPSRVGRAFGRASYVASAAILVAEGAYDGATIVNCAVAPPK